VIGLKFKIMKSSKEQILDLSLFFRTKTVLAGSLKEASGSICDPLETLNQKFLTKISKIWGNLEHFGNVLATFLLAVESKSKNLRTCLFVLYNFAVDT